jgi:hypothetical protein
MTKRPKALGLRGATALLAAGSLFVMTGCASAPLPVQVLNSQQTGQVQGFTEISLASAGFTTRALSNVQTLNGNKPDVERSGAQTSAAYAGASLPGQQLNPVPGPAVSGPAPDGSKFAFLQAGDAAQAWATMTSNGMPYLFVNAFGASTSEGTASWRAQVQIPAGGANLYVQFRLPSADIEGFTEVLGPGTWQSRVSAELQMNGHPVWSTEATRISPNKGVDVTSGQNCPGENGGAGGTGPYLSTFGAGVGFTGDPQQASAAQPVTLSLGAFPAGQTVDVEMIVRANAQVLSLCCPAKMDNQPVTFCTRASASIGWDNTATPVRFWVGPAV